MQARKGATSADDYLPRTVATVRASTCDAVGAARAVAAKKAVAARVKNCILAVVFLRLRK